MRIFEEMAASVFRPAAYAEFARRKGGRALAYLVLIALPLALTGAIRLGAGASQIADIAARSVAGGPDFHVTGGVLEFDAPQPYLLSIDGQDIGLVDTTGATDASYLTGRDSFVLFLRDRMILKNGLQRQEMVYADLGPGETSFSRTGISGFLTALGGWSWPIGAIWLLGSVGSKMVAALALALFALVVLSIRNRSGGWAAAWNVACHALTLPLLLGFVRVLAGANIRMFGLLYWGAAVIYAVAGLSTLPALAAGQAAGPDGGPSNGKGAGASGGPAGGSPGGPAGGAPPGD